MITVKMIGRKILNLWRHPIFAYPRIPYNIFPETSIPTWQIVARLRGVHTELFNRPVHNNLGSLYGLPHPFALRVYRQFLDQNPNHLGNWSNKPSQEPTQQLEYEVVQKLITLSGGKQKTTEGYITTGGTEANIFVTWLGRACLEQYIKSNNICLIYTSLTHYSVTKAARICNVPHYLTPLNPTTWSMHATGLINTITSLYKRGFRGFLLPLTMGYTSTGTRDDIPSILHIVKRLQKKHVDIHFFIWVDAAFNGLIEPFGPEQFTPMASPYIQAHVVDFHKFGQVPYPSGVILYRKKLRRLIEKPIDYLEEKDSTLLGSRTGIPAVCIWAMMLYRGKNGYRKIVQIQKKNKTYFISQLKHILPKVEIITHDQSLSCGVVFHSLKNQRLSKMIEEKYWLHPGDTKILWHPHREQTITIYKVFFLPHVTQKTIMEFINDVKTLH